MASYYATPEPAPPFGTLLVGLLALVLYLVLWHCTTRGRWARWWLLPVALGLAVGLVVQALREALTTSELLALAYGLPWLYMHAYFGWQYWRARRPVPALGRPAAYEQLQAAHRGLGFTAYVFPVGLALYWPWYRRHVAALRNAPVACPTCGQPMHRLDGTAEQAHLEPAQQIEEASRAVDYDVWECPSGHHLPLAYPNPDSRTRQCPACHHRTLPPPRLRVVQAATTAADGWGWRVATCRFCQHEEKTKETIPRQLTPAERAAASSSSSSSWGSGSGSSSSGSSSSTSSGGSSGGGGAGSNW